MPGGGEMVRIEAYRAGCEAAAAMLAAEIEASRAEEEALARLVRSRSAAAAARRGAASRLRARAERIERIPLVGSLLGRGRRAEADAAAADVAALEAEMSSIKARGRRAREETALMRSLSRELSDAAGAAGALLHAPDDMGSRAEAAGNRAAFVRRRGKPSRAQILDVCRRIVEVGREMRQRTAVPVPVRPGPPAAPAPVPARSDGRGSRVYLPIPFSMGHAARRAGALYDPDVRVGSRMYVNLGTDLAPFERMLPLSFRRNPPKLSFPPIRPGAAGQAIWGVFDRETWDHVRSSAYERTGRRCMLCGKHSGTMKSRIFPEARGGRTGPVECHEVWEWSVPDEGSGIGIQRLRALLVLCFECHAVFHESFMVEAARKVGLGAEVEAFIEARRLALTRMDPAEMAQSLARAEAEFKAHAGVGEWVMDLSHLGSQDFMAHASPVLVEGNRAGVAPEMVAGLSFVTDGGREFEARPADEVYAAAVAGRVRVQEPAGGTA